MFKGVRFLPSSPWLKMQRCFSGNHVLSDAERVARDMVSAEKGEGSVGVVERCMCSVYTCISQNWRYGHILVHPHGSCFNLIFSSVLIRVIALINQPSCLDSMQSLNSLKAFLLVSASISFWLKIRNSFFCQFVVYCDFGRFISILDWW